MQPPLPQPVDLDDTLESLLSTASFSGGALGVLEAGRSPRALSCSSVHLLGSSEDTLSYFTAKGLPSDGMQGEARSLRASHSLPAAPAAAFPPAAAHASASDDLGAVLQPSAGPPEQAEQASQVPCARLPPPSRAKAAARAPERASSLLRSHDVLDDPTCVYSNSSSLDDGSSDMAPLGLERAAQPRGIHGVADERVLGSISLSVTLGSMAAASPRL